MFKKIVSRLPFSPTLIGELGFYAKRLSKEEASRKLGLILTALALVVQSFVVFSPPESANAANLSDLVHGGIHSKAALLKAWDNNTQGFRDLLKHAGLSRSSLEAAKNGEINTRTGGKSNGWLSWGRVSRGGAKYNETAMKVDSQTIYVRSLSALDTGNNVKGGGSYYPSFILKNNKGKQVIIIKGCGNIAMKERPSSDKDIKVCELSSRKIITIRESQFSSSKHSKNHADCEPKPIQVCDLKTSTIVTIDEKDFNSSRYSKNLEDCQPKPQPTATCSSLIVKKISRTNIELQAAANAVNGASIKSYTYIIKDGSGKEVFRKTVTSASSSHSLKHELANDGKYTAQVIVGSSLGDKTSEACEAAFSIDPIEQCPLNPSLPINDPDCQPCPGDPTLWVKDEACTAQIVRNKQAKNLSLNVSAEEAKAGPDHRLEYTLTAKNDGLVETTFKFEDDLSDILEYGELFDRGGGDLSEQDKILSWPEIILQPGDEQQRTYVIKMPSEISSMARGTSDPTSYDCKMINTFGNTIEVEVECAGPKIVEQVIVPELPRTGATENIIFGGIVAAVVSFLYLRSRQLNKEVRLIRREFTAGTI